MNNQNSPTRQLLVAASFAAEKHRSQRRKDAEATPYINHPLKVARILIEAGVEDSDVLVAAMLHDTIEDTETTAREIALQFGENVSRLVAEVTDDKSLPKQERKRLQIANAPSKSDGAKLIKIADKIANLQDLKDAPPEWPEQRIVRYRQWASQVISGCAGVNLELDEHARTLIDEGVRS